MKKILLAFTFLCMMVAASNAQTAAKSVYFELGGPGLASLNFDTRFTKKEDGIGGKIGIGGFSIEGASIIFVPVGINYLFGKDQKNYFEVGGGITPIFGNDGSTLDGNFSTTFGHLNFGYRLQPLNGGFTFRAFITPVFAKGFFLPYYGGVSFGYKF